MNPYDPSKTKIVTRRKLPHWQQAHCTYYITFRLADSIPKAKFMDWNERRKRWLRSHHISPDSSPENLPDSLKQQYYQTFIKQFHTLLDNGHGSCLLKISQHAKIVSDALHFFRDSRYQLGDYVIMPNHVHLLVTPHENYPLKKITHSWKSYTAKKINHLIGKTGQLWQHESYDHIVRNEEQLKRIQQYIQNNPKNLPPHHYILSSSLK